MSPRRLQFVGLVLFVAACLPVLSAAAEPFDKAAGKELKALEGVWVVQRIEANGEKHELGANDHATLTIAGKKWSFPATKQEGEIIALDATTDPKLIDMKATAKGRPDLVREGIYKLDGDTLMICMYQKPDKKRRPGSTRRRMKAQCYSFTSGPSHDGGRRTRVCRPSHPA